MTTGEWEKNAVTQLGCADSTFGKLKAEAVADNRVELRGKGWFHKPKPYSVDLMTGKIREHEAKAANSAWA
jgi:hypothetical protein